MGRPQSHVLPISDLRAYARITKGLAKHVKGSKRLANRANANAGARSPKVQTEHNRANRCTFTKGSYRTQQGQQVHVHQRFIQNTTGPTGARSPKVQTQSSVKAVARTSCPGIDRERGQSVDQGENSRKRRDEEAPRSERGRGIAVAVSKGQKDN
jgi:hypothetical protein